MIWYMNYFHILAVRKSKADIFEEIEGLVAKLKALSIPVISYLIRKTSKGLQLLDTVLLSKLVMLKKFPVSKNFNY